MLLERREKLRRRNGSHCEIEGDPSVGVFVIILLYCNTGGLTCTMILILRHHIISSMGNTGIASCVVTGQHVLTFTNGVVY